MWLRKHMEQGSNLDVPRFLPAGVLTLTSDGTHTHMVHGPQVLMYKGGLKVQYSAAGIHSLSHHV